MDDYIEALEKMINDLIRIRRELHSNPETGFKEFNTSLIISRWLKDCGISDVRSFAQTGIVCCVPGKEKRPVAGLRVDIDALYTEDKKMVDHASKIKGISHACGHDVHTVIGLGVAFIISEMRHDFPGTVKIIFQPSEEMPKNDESEFDVYTEKPVALRGAQIAIESGVLTDPDIDFLIGIHCNPELKCGQIGYQYGNPMAGGANFRLSVSGKAGHAANPYKCTDAILTSAQIIQSLYLALCRKISLEIPYVMTVGTIKGGTRRSSIAGLVDITGTARAFDNELLSKKIPEIMEAVIEGTTKANGASYNFEYGVAIPPVINDNRLVDITADALKKFSDIKGIEMKGHEYTSDDFSFMSHIVPSIYLKLGTSNDLPATRYPLHSNYFDVDENCIKVGIRGLMKIIIDICKNYNISEDGYDQKKDQ